MELTILGATGATGAELVTQALDRGHSVVALVRDPAKLPARPGITPIVVDVHEASSIAAGVAEGAVVLSALGNVAGDTRALSAGARAVIAAGAERVLWLGAFGTGESAAKADPLSRIVVRMMREELPDKAAAEAAVLAAGGTVFHAGPLTTKPVGARRRARPLTEIGSALLPSPVSRATVAAAMLDEAELPRHPGAVVVPRER